MFSLRVRGVDASCPERTVRVQQAQHTAVRAAQLQNKKMGLEKEKMETSVIMDEDEFNRSIEPILGKKPNVYSEVQDRDPKDINAHLKVGDNARLITYILSFICKYLRLKLTKHERY